MSVFNVGEKYIHSNYGELTYVGENTEKLTEEFFLKTKHRMPTDKESEDFLSNAGEVFKNKAGELFFFDKRIAIFLHKRIILIIGARYLHGTYGEIEYLGETTKEHIETTEKKQYKLPPTAKYIEMIQKQMPYAFRCMDGDILLLSDPSLLKEL